MNLLKTGSLLMGITAVNILITISVVDLRLATGYGGPDPQPVAGVLNGDFNCDGAHTISDAFGILNYLFASGPGFPDVACAQAPILTASEAMELKDLLLYLTVEEGDFGGGSQPLLRISGANLQIIDGFGSQTGENALGNLIVGYGEFPQGAPMEMEHSILGSHNIVFGRANVAESSGSLVGGVNNNVTARGGCSLGGQENSVVGPLAVAVGGESNTIGGGHASAIGGTANQANGSYTVCVAGSGNECPNTTTESSCVGGQMNQANGEASAIVGGFTNSSPGLQAVVVAGRLNVGVGEAALSVGGEGNDPDGRSAVTVGGFDLSTSVNRTVVVGGDNVAGGTTADCARIGLSCPP